MEPSSNNIVVDSDTPTCKSNEIDLCKINNVGPLKGISLTKETKSSKRIDSKTVEGSANSSSMFFYYVVYAILIIMYCMAFYMLSDVINTILDKDNDQDENIAHSYNAIVKLVVWFPFLYLMWIANKYTFSEELRMNEQQHIDNEQQHINKSKEQLGDYNSEHGDSDSEHGYMISNLWNIPGSAKNKALMISATILGSLMFVAFIAVTTYYLYLSNLPTWYMVVFVCSTTILLMIATFISGYINNHTYLTDKSKEGIFHLFDCALKLEINRKMENLDDSMGMDGTISQMQIRQSNLENTIKEQSNKITSPKNKREESHVNLCEKHNHNIHTFTSNLKYNQNKHLISSPNLQMEMEKTHIYSKTEARKIIKSAQDMMRLPIDIDGIGVNDLVDLFRKFDVDTGNYYDKNNTAIFKKETEEEIKEEEEEEIKEEEIKKEAEKEINKKEAQEESIQENKLLIPNEQNLFEHTVKVKSTTVETRVSTLGSTIHIEFFHVQEGSKLNMQKFSIQIEYTTEGFAYININSKMCLILILEKTPKALEVGDVSKALEVGDVFFMADHNNCKNRLPPLAPEKCNGFFVANNDSVHRIKKEIDTKSSASTLQEPEQGIGDDKGPLKDDQVLLWKEKDIITIKHLLKNISDSDLVQAMVLSFTDGICTLSSKECTLSSKESNKSKESNNNINRMIAFRVSGDEDSMIEIAANVDVYLGCAKIEGDMQHTTYRLIITQEDSKGGQEEDRATVRILSEVLDSRVQKALMKNQQRLDENEAQQELLYKQIMLFNMKKEVEKAKAEIKQRNKREQKQRTRSLFDAGGMYRDYPPIRARSVGAEREKEKKPFTRERGGSDHI